MTPQSIIRAAGILAAGIAGLGAFSATAAAQDSTGHVVIYGPHQPNEFERRSSGVFSVIQSRPMGALAHNITFGYGGNATYLLRLDSDGYVALRADAGFVQYGDESKEVPLSPTIGGRIQVKVSTNNNIVPLAIGPQLMWPRGTLRPYVNAGIGGQFFFTESHVNGVDDNLDFARTTNQWDKTMNWVLGGGLYLPVYQRNVKVDIDLGAQYLTGGHARYLRPGSIEDQPDGSIRINSLESDTHMMLVRIGVKIGI